MSHYRRCYVPGGSFFFTVVTDRRAPILGTDLARDLLRAAFRDCLYRWPPFRVDAMVMLDNHLHAIWTLCRLTIPTIRNVGAQSKNTTLNPGWRSAVQKNPSRLRASVIADVASGNLDFGNMRYAMNGTMPDISITSTTIQ